MKKFVCLMMALAMVFSLSVTAGAEAADQTLNAIGQTNNIPVDVTVNPANVKVERYSVKITWKDLSFTYKAAGSKGNWNPENHTYTDAAYGWKQADGSSYADTTVLEEAITIINHSNVDVYVTLVSNDTGNGSAKASFKETDTEHPITARRIVSAEERGVDDSELKVTSVLTMSGIPETSAIVANVVVSIAASA